MNDDKEPLGVFKVSVEENPFIFDFQEHFPRSDGRAICLLDGHSKSTEGVE